MTRVAAHKVSHYLSKDQKRARTFVAQTLLERFENEGEDLLNAW